MRIRRSDNSPSPFSLRACLALTTFSALLIWVGAVYFLWILASTALHYFVLAHFALLARRSSRLDVNAPFARWRTPQRELATLRVGVIVFVGFLGLIHLIIVLTFFPIAFPIIWHTPTIASLTLAQIERSTIVGFSLLLVISFLLGVYGGGSFSRRVCMETSGALTLLHACHFLIP